MMYIKSLIITNQHITYIRHKIGLLSSEPTASEGEQEADPSPLGPFRRIIGIKSYLSKL